VQCETISQPNGGKKEGNTTSAGQAFDWLCLQSGLVAGIILLGRYYGCIPKVKRSNIVRDHSGPRDSVMLVNTATASIFYRKLRIPVESYALGQQASHRLIYCCILTFLAAPSSQLKPYTTLEPVNRPQRHLQLPHAVRDRCLRPKFMSDPDASSRPFSQGICTTINIFSCTHVITGATFLFTLVPTCFQHLSHYFRSGESRAYERSLGTLFETLLFTAEDIRYVRSVQVYNDQCYQVNF
jgi:hypothetical protein